MSHPHRRATPAHVQRPAPRQPGRHQPAEGSAGLQVIWPRVLRFDRKDVLRLTTLPNADVTVTLRVVPQENSSIQPAQSHALRRITLVYRFTARAHADGHGHATVRLRYAYVPPRPEPATLGVVVRAGRRILQQNARVQLVRG